MRITRGVSPGSGIEPEPSASRPAQRRRDSGRGSRRPLTVPERPPRTIRHILSGGSLISLRDRLFGRLLVAILILMAASEVAVDVVMYYRLRGTLEADLGRRLVRTADALVVGMDARLLSQFRVGDEALGAYTVVRSRLQEQVRANGLDRGYVVDRDLRALVDTSATASIGDTHYVLLANRSQTGQVWGGTSTATPIYVNEAGGLRLTALAPVRAPDGAVAALLGIDAAPDFFAALGELRREMALLGVASLAVAGVGGMFLMRGASRRLDRVRDTVGRASRGDFTAQSDQRTNDPVGALARDLDGFLESVVTRVNTYESLMASVDIGLIAADLSGTVIGANKAAARWLNRGHRLPGQPLLDVLSIDPGLAAFGAKALREPEPSFTREIVVRDGVTAGRTLAAVASPLIQGGRRTGVTLSLADVTVLRTLERQAHAQDRLAALGTMAGGLLHEVRSPLASISMHLDLLRPSVVGPEGRDILDQAIGSAERLASFLVDFQIVAGLRPLRREWVDFCECVEDACAQIAVPSHVRLRRACRGPAVVHADGGLLAPAIRNILLNAIDAVSPSGGAVDVDTTLAASDVVFTVRDTGTGIAVEHIEHVFDPMFTTKPKGTGLGLTIAKRVVDAHGGTVEAANDAQGGALFTVRWPRQQPRGSS